MNPDSVKSLNRYGHVPNRAVMALMIAVCLTLGVLPLNRSVLAQSPQPNQAASPPAGLTTLSFGFEPKTSTRLELKQVENRNINTVPTETYAYRAEVRNEPTRNQPYYQYEAQKERKSHAVLRVKNEGTKTVASVEWEFTHPRFQGDKEIVNYQVRTRLNIPPGQEARLAQEVPQYDCNGAIHSMVGGRHYIANRCGRNPAKTTGTYPVEARIKQVKFTDGTVWQATP